LQSCKTNTIATADKKEIVSDKKYGIHTEYMDTSVKPNEDFLGM